MAYRLALVSKLLNWLKRGRAGAGADGATAHATKRVRDVASTGPRPRGRGWGENPLIVEWENKLQRGRARAGADGTTGCHATKSRLGCFNGAAPARARME